jgi:hypothetical protein
MEIVEGEIFKFALKMITRVNDEELSASVFATKICPLKLF